MIDFTFGENGGGAPILGKQQPRTVACYIAVERNKVQINLPELARLRWIERWSYEKLAGYFNLSEASIKRRLQRVRLYDADLSKEYFRGLK